MSIVIPDEGKARFMDRALKQINPYVGSELILRLYTNTPVLNSALTGASFTEATIAGYSAIIIPDESWFTFKRFVAPVTTSTSFTAAPTPTFNFTASGTIQGYYVTETLSGDVMWAESLGGISVISGTSLPITLGFTLE